MGQNMVAQSYVLVACGNVVAAAPDASDVDANLWLRS